MTNAKLDPKIEKKVKAAQRTEITEHYIYGRLSRVVKSERNREILSRISEDELRHHKICILYSCQDIRPNRFKIWLYYLIARLFGITFGLKLMERGEAKAHAVYTDLAKTIPEVAQVIQDEIQHEKELVGLIDDERLEYSSDVVRGLTVALVELSGALAGFSFALQTRDLVLTAGIIIGATTSLSIIGTEYLATKSSTSIKSPFKSAVYAGLANIVTVLILLLPFFIFGNIYAALGFMILAAVLMIFILTFYLSVVRATSIVRMFLEMTAISLGIAALAFAIGYVAREFLHIHI